MARNSPSRFADKFMVRFPEGMRDRLAASARVNRRSMNAELVIHLEAGLAGQGGSLPHVTSAPEGGSITQFSRD